MVLAAVTAAVGPALPATAADSPAATADSPAGAVTLAPSPRFVPRATQLLHAGDTGFLFAQEGDDRLLWTDYATGTTTQVGDRLPGKVQYDVDGTGFTYAAPAAPGYYGAGSETLALYSESPAPHVTLQQGAGGSGGAVDIPIPEGQVYAGTFGSAVLTAVMSGEQVTGHRLLRVSDGQVVAEDVTGLPDGAVAQRWAEDGDARSVILRYKQPDAADTYDHWALVDLTTGVATPLPDRPLPDEPWTVGGFRLGKETLLRLAPGRMPVHVLDRAAPDSPPRTLDASLDGAATAALGAGALVATGTNAGDNEYNGGPLLLVTESGRTTLLASARADIAIAPDGSAIVAGAVTEPAYGTNDWAFYRISWGADGKLSRQRLTDVQPMPAHIHGLSLGSGILTTADTGTIYQPGTYIGGYRSTWLSTTGAPAPTGAPTVDGYVRGDDSEPCGDENYCVDMRASGDGYHGRRQPTDRGLTMVLKNGDASHWGPRVDTGDSSPRLTSLSGRYAVVDGASSKAQYLVEFRESGDSTVLKTRTSVAATVWGSTLWSASGTAGEVTATSIPSGASLGSFKTANGCVPSELQAVGRWVYWRCYDSSWERGAGVYDRVSGRTVTGPAGGNVLLGDGYVVQGTTASGLTLYDLHNGLPASGALADVPSKPLAGAGQFGPQGVLARRTWTVDRFGGHVAYAGADQQVRVVPTGVPASPLLVIDSKPAPAALDLTAPGAAWSGTWWLSKPAASWQLAVRHVASGLTVRTLQGGEVRGRLTPSWDGKDEQGQAAPNGEYRLELTVRPADGQGADLVVPSPLEVSGGSEPPAPALVPRDHAGANGPDGVADLMTLSPSGALSFQHGSADGTFSGATTGTGWGTSNMVVPFGDLNGDGCNDVLLRTGVGHMRAYTPACGSAMTAETPYTYRGRGWEQYDVLTSPGDMTGDGLPDLVARQTSTGDMYLYENNGAGWLKARVLFAGNWKLYRSVFGAGDLDGDGIGDLLAVDGAGALWRYDGLGNGYVRNRVAVFGTGWANGRDAFVGVGDITGDGVPDVVSRTTGGDLLRNDGTGSGTLRATVKIGSGWQGYVSLF
ncbi:FG-GAP-like repeat-containing protein [Streptomyces sp. TRM49041]|uniref:FG-GAP-like repeat-containing protein n=1 Tax=Streptomyces sp. TRM49041 TaxID=2603216 RepID=UPI0021CC9AB2|nr:FG-GAP-like repeat-containing protein [Streptomyces sp. TRM49041]